MTGAPRDVVLVVEDSDEDFDTVLEAVRRSGRALDVRRAETGDRCLAMLNGPAGQRLRPRLLLLDLNTPGRDGRDVLQEVRRDGGLLHLPIVVLTTSANPRDVEWCYEQGANAYHVKPVTYPDYVRDLDLLFAYWFDSVLTP